MGFQMSINLMKLQHMLQRCELEVKQRQEMVEFYKSVNRPDLANAAIVTMEQYKLESYLINQLLGEASAT